MTIPTSASCSHNTYYTETGSATSLNTHSTLVYINLTPSPTVTSTPVPCIPTTPATLLSTSQTAPPRAGELRVPTIIGISAGASIGLAAAMLLMILGVCCVCRRTKKRAVSGKLASRSTSTTKFEEDFAKESSGDVVTVGDELNSTYSPAPAKNHDLPTTDKTLQQRDCIEMKEDHFYVNTPNASTSGSTYYGTTVARNSVEDDTGQCLYDRVEEEAIAFYDTVVEKEKNLAYGQVRSITAEDDYVIS